MVSGTAFVTFVAVAVFVGKVSTGLSLRLIEHSFRRSRFFSSLQKHYRYDMKALCHCVLAMDTLHFPTNNTSSLIARTLS